MHLKLDMMLLVAIPYNIVLAAPASPGIIVSENQAISTLSADVNNLIGTPSTATIQQRGLLDLFNNDSPAEKQAKRWREAKRVVQGLSSSGKNAYERVINNSESLRTFADEKVYPRDRAKADQFIAEVQTMKSKGSGDQLYANFLYRIGDIRKANNSGKDAPPFQWMEG